MEHVVRPEADINTQHSALWILEIRENSVATPGPFPGAAGPGTRTSRGGIAGDDVVRERRPGGL